MFVAQGQVTQKQFVWSGPKSNSSKILCLSSLPARLKKIQSKRNVLSRPLFSIINLWEKNSTLKGE